MTRDLNKLAAFIFACAAVLVAVKYLAAQIDT